MGPRVLVPCGFEKTREQDKGLIGTHLFLAVVWIAVEAAKRSLFSLVENPADPGSPPFPSVSCD